MVARYNYFVKIGGYTMKDTFKKLSKDAISAAKTEVNSGLETAKGEVTNTVIGANQTRTSNLGSNIVKKAIGTADLLVFKEPSQVSTIIAAFLLDNEQVYFYLSSAREEIAVTNLGLVYTKKLVISTEKTTVKREEYRHNQVTNLRIETAGFFDRDAELKFMFGEDKVSWDINKTELDLLFKLYKSLNKISNLQKEITLATSSIDGSLAIATNAIKYSSTADLEQTFKAIYQFSKQQIETTHKIDFKEAF